MARSANVRCPRELREAVERMLLDLDLMSLRVGLIPAPEPQYAGHSVRMVWGHNPRWYRELCALYPRHRRHRDGHYTDSLINRRDTRRVLTKLLGEGSTSQLAAPLLAFAKDIRAAEIEAELAWAFGECDALALGACGM